MLGMNQDIQERVYEEQHDIFGETDRDVDFVDLSRMCYLEQCIKETLRLFAPVPLFLRYASKDIPISDGHIIPAGSNILVSISGVHYDPKIYSEPFVWNPENFAPANEASRHKCSFVPFSTGPRECIGKKYAMVFLKTQLSILLRTYRIQTNMRMIDIERDNDVLVRSKTGYYISLKLREKRIPPV